MAINMGKPKSRGSLGKLLSKHILFLAEQTEYYDNIVLGVLRMQIKY